MVRGVVPACWDEGTKSSKQNRRNTIPDRLTPAYLLGPIHDLVPGVTTTPRA